MDSSASVHPRVVSGLRNFFADFFAKRKELRLDADTETERRMPEFFLTLPTPLTADGDLTLHIYCEENMPAREATDKILNDLIPFRLDGNRVRVKRYECQQQTQMYEDFTRTGTTYYLHPAALRQLATSNVSGDPYGFLSLSILWIHVLLFMATMLLLLIAGEWDWFFLLATAVVLSFTYFVLNRLVNVESVRQALSRRRGMQFSLLLSDCQQVGQRHLNEALAVEVPVSVLERLNALPSSRPQPINVLGPADWRMAELWDLAHEAVHELAKTPESSPQYPYLTRRVEQLLDQAALAFREASSPSTDEAKLDELYKEVSHHAQALAGLQGSRKIPRSGGK